MALDIPKNDLECWSKYPKHHWVYELSRLLDAQNVKWSPCKTDAFSQRLLNLNLDHLDISTIADNSPGFIYVAPTSDTKTLTEVFLVKGELKHIHHLDVISNSVITEILGDVELRINAFITLYFQRFTGTLCIETYGNTIYSISLKPSNFELRDFTPEVEKLIKKIYKKSEDEYVREAITV